MHVHCGMYMHAHRHIYTQNKEITIKIKTDVCSQVSFHEPFLPYLLRLPLVPGLVLYVRVSLGQQPLSDVCSVNLLVAGIQS